MRYNDYFLHSKQCHQSESWFGRSTFGTLVHRWGMLWRSMTCSLKHANLAFVVMCKLNNLCTEDFLHSRAARDSHPGEDDGAGCQTPAYTREFPFAADSDYCVPQPTRTGCLDRQFERRDRITAALAAKNMKRLNSNTH